jgi:NTE family protein
MAERSGHEHQRDLLIAILEGLLGGASTAVVDVLLPKLSWRELLAGELLFRQDEQGEELYLVVSGRLRATVTGPGGEVVAVGEIMRGQSVGEMALLTGERRSASIVAIRDSVLACLSRSVYEEIVRLHPHLAVSLTRLIVERLKNAANPQASVTRPINICLLAVTDGVDAVALGHALARKLSFGNRVLVIGRDMAENGEGLSAEQYQQLTRWLDEVESNHEFLIFVADPVANDWTRRCIRAADQVVLLARADQGATHSIEACLELAADGAAARRTLVLLHDEDERMPRNTRDWLARYEVEAHLHIRPTLDRDIARLARTLSGTTVGLVLSGGGARGFAHLGVLKALEEFGAQIDDIGGASIGAIIGAYCAFDLPVAEMIKQARQAFARGPTGDFNVVPLLSLVGGRRLKRVIDDAVLMATGGDSDIEDTWKSLFCVVSNYTQAAEVSATRGNLAKWLRTSVSIPGVLPLVPHDGELLGDGGSFNNFPTDVMVRRGTGYVIGSDLLQRGFRVVDVDEMPGNWQLALDKLRPRRSRRYHVPGLTATLVSAIMLVSQSRQREARQQANLCFTPALKGYGMLDWRKFDAIVDLGYRHACEVLAQLPSCEAARIRGASVAARGAIARTPWDALGDDFYDVQP